MEINIKVANIFKEVLTFNYRYVLIKSGRLGGKTTFAIQLAVALSASFIDRDIIITRNDYSSLEDSSYNEFINWLNEFNLEDYFQIKKDPLRIYNSKTNSTIYFKGIGGADKSRTRSMRTINKVIAVIFEELQQVKDRESLEQAHASFRRLLDQDKGMFIHLFNPEPINSHWLNIYYNLKSKDKDWLCIHSSYKDVLNFISDLDLREILKMKLTDFPRYEWMYEGKASGGFGAVYYEFKREKHLLSREQALLKFKDRRIVGCIIGVDSAVTRDKTAYVPIFLLDNGQGIVSGRDIFIHDPKLWGAYGSVELMPHILKWYKSIENNYGFKENNIPTIMVVDSAATELIRILQYNMPEHVYVNKFDKPSIVNMVDTVKGVLARNTIYLIDDGYHWSIKDAYNCENILAEELENLKWKEKLDGSTPTTYDASTPNDASDAFTYAVCAWYKNPENIYWVEELNYLTNSRNEIYDYQ